MPNRGCLSWLFQLVLTNENRFGHPSNLPKVTNLSCIDSILFMIVFSLREREGFTWRCSAREKMLLTILQNLQESTESTFAGVTFLIKLLAFYRIPPDNCFWNVSNSPGKMVLATGRSFESICSGT